MPEQPPATPAKLRAMAEQVRALARGRLPRDEIVRRLLDMAAELEAEADVLERRNRP
jgi:hypothetical protein